MISELGLLWMTGLPLMGSPGPATLSVAAAGAAYGPKRGLRYMLGVSAGTASVLVMIASGVTGLVLAVPGAAVSITILGAFYILYLAYAIATAPVLDKVDVRAKAPRFAGGYVLAIANPKAYAALGAIVSSTSVLPEVPVWDAVAKIAALSVLVFIINGTWLMLGSAISALMTDPRKSRVVNLVMAALLLILWLWCLSERPRP